MYNSLKLSTFAVIIINCYIIINDMAYEEKSIVKKTRIEYIDAMRGFTMILVVVCHVSGFCLGIESDIPSIHPFLYEFRMPTFFFISGFVLYKTEQIWNYRNVCLFLKKKFPVQIITTAIFFLIFIHINNISIKEGIFSESKLGYWFTYNLFIFFIVYSISRFFLYLFKCNEAITDLSIIFIGILFYLLFSVRSIYYDLPINTDIKNLLSLQHWGFFLFFTIGTLFKKHYQKILLLIDQRTIIFISIIIYFGANLFYKELTTYHINLLNISTALSGIILVFSFFYIHQFYFTKDKLVGRILQLIGRRTLDIYLLHYLIIPVNLIAFSSIFHAHPMPLIEFLVSLIISLFVIGACLVISTIIRLSHYSSYLCFGVKK